MSDAKPRRMARDSARHDMPAGEPLSADAVSEIATPPATATAAAALAVNEFASDAAAQAIEAFPVTMTEPEIAAAPAAAAAAAAGAAMEAAESLSADAAAAATEAAESLAAEAAAAAVNTAAAGVAEAAENPWAALAEAQAALARGFEAIAVEMTGITQSGLAVSADAAVALIGARTFAEAVEINASLARRGLGVMLEGSARLSEIGVKAATEASRPILSRLGASWDAPSG